MFNKLHQNVYDTLRDFSDTDIHSQLDRQTDGERDLHYFLVASLHYLIIDVNECHLCACLRLT